MPFGGLSRSYLEVKERSLLANTAWGIVSNLLRVIISLIFIPIVLIKIGTTGYGIFGILMLLTYNQGFVGQLDFGYFGFLVKEIAKCPSHEAFETCHRKVAPMLTVMLCALVLLFALIYFFFSKVVALFNVPGEFEEYYLLSLHFIFLTNIFCIISAPNVAFLMSQHQNALIKKVETFYFLFFNLLAVFLVVWKKTLMGLVLAFSISQILQSIHFVLIVRSHFKRSFSVGRISLSSFFSDWSHWRPFFFAKLNGLAFRQTDTAIITFFLGPQAVALYEISMKIPSFLKATLARVSEAFISFSGARQKREEQGEISEMLADIIFFQAGAALTLSICLLFYSKEILFAWLGQGFNLDLRLGLQIASFVPVFTAFCSVPAALFLGRDDYSGFMTKMPTFLSIGNLIASVPLTYFFGFIGTIFATVIQYLLYAVFLFRPIQKNFRISFRKLAVRLFNYLTLLIPCELAIKYVLAQSENRQTVFIIILVGNAILGLVFYTIYKNDIFSLRRRMAITARASN